MLLVRKAPYFPTKHSSGSVIILESNPRLLQKNRAFKKKSINPKRKRITCNLSIEMRITKL